LTYGRVKAIEICSKRALFYSHSTRTVKLLLNILT
jgi:hypothetical protein